MLPWLQNRDVRDLRPPGRGRHEGEIRREDEDEGIFGGFAAEKTRWSVALGTTEARVRVGEANSATLCS